MICFILDKASKLLFDFILISLIRLDSALPEMYLGPCAYPVLSIVAGMGLCTFCFCVSCLRKRSGVPFL